MKMRWFLGIASILVCLIISGCGESNIDTSLINNTAGLKEAFGEQGNIYILQIPSQGGINDTIVASLVATAGPNTTVHQIAEKMAMGEKQAVRLTVTGYSSVKNKTYIQSAVKLNEGKNLSMLKFMYLGFPEDEQEIRKAVESTGAKFYFKSFITDKL